MTKLWLIVLLGALLAGGVLAQEATPSAAVPPAIALELALIDFPQTFDPLLVSAAGEIDFVNNLFVGLTRSDPATQTVLPALAESWAVDEAGTRWTFTLRTDVNWVRYDAASASVISVRPITAADVVYSIQRLCSSTEQGYYAVTVFASKIAGCAAGQAAGDGALAEVSAPDATTVSITLTGAYSYFLAMTRMWTIRPVPAEALAAHGAAWSEPQNLISSGAFALAEANPDEGLVLVSNPFYPADLSNGGNVTRVNFTRVEDVFDQYARYRRDQFDWSDIPLRDVGSARRNERYAAELQRLDLPVVYYFGFAQDKPPFDDVHVRRAFAAALDRAALVDAVLQDAGTAIAHFTPPGLVGAPPLKAAFDVGYDPAFARAQMAASAYPACADFPPIRIRVFEGAFAWAEALVLAAQTLGCDPARFDIEELRLPDLQAAIDPQQPAAQRPHLFALGWGADYPDADSFLTPLACAPTNPLMRPCSPVDEQIAAARAAPEAERAALYAEIEAAFFGAAGEFPVIPLFVNATYRLFQTWLTGPFQTDGQFGGVHYDAYTLDLEATLAARVQCDVIGLGPANLRDGPATTFAVAGRIQQGEVLPAIAQTSGRDGFVWWQLASNNWVREDVVRESGDCERLPDAFAQ